MRKRIKKDRFQMKMDLKKMSIFKNNYDRFYCIHEYFIARKEYINYFLVSILYIIISISISGLILIILLRLSLINLCR